MNKLSKEERSNRIVARGEHSNHSHVVVGNATIERNDKGEITITAHDNDCVLKHILETEWMNGNEVWTGEHKDIALKEGTYKYVAQTEYDPFEERIRQVLD